MLHGPRACLPLKLVNIQITLLQAYFSKLLGTNLACFMLLSCKHDRPASFWLWSILSLQLSFLFLCSDCLLLLCLSQVLFETQIYLSHDQFLHGFRKAGYKVNVCFFFAIATHSIPFWLLCGWIASLIMAGHSVVLSECLWQLSVSLLPHLLSIFLLCTIFSSFL